jgi:hypothetical protein
MTKTFTFTDCCTLLDVDPKTLRQWLKRDGIEPQVSAIDSRIKFLTGEQVHHIATIHRRDFKLASAELEPIITPETFPSLVEHVEQTQTEVQCLGTQMDALQKHLVSSMTSPLSVVSVQIAHFLEETTSSLHQLDVALAALQHTLSEGETDDDHAQGFQEQVDEPLLHRLASLEDLLRQQEQQFIGRVTRLEAQLSQAEAQIIASVLKELQILEIQYERRLIAFGSSLTRSLEHLLTKDRRAERCPRKTRRARLATTVEYGAGGGYVLINRTTGEVKLLPNSAEWFNWLVSLSSFHFQGQSGRFTARQERKFRGDTYWYAYRKAHNQAQYIRW